MRSPSSTATGRPPSRPSTPARGRRAAVLLTSLALATATGCGGSDDAAPRTTTDAAAQLERYARTFEATCRRVDRAARRLVRREVQAARALRSGDVITSRRRLLVAGGAVLTDVTRAYNVVGRLDAAPGYSGFQVNVRRLARATRTKQRLVRRLVARARRSPDPRTLDAALNRVTGLLRGLSLRYPEEFRPYAPTCLKGQRRPELDPDSRLT